MEVNTLIIGYVPLTDTSGKTKVQIRNHDYMKDLINEFDLGNLYCVSHASWKEKIDEINPLIIISLCGDYFAEEVQNYKNDAMLYSAIDGASIFHRKAETEEKKEKNRRIFKEVERLVKDAREKGEKEIEAMRHYSAMSYNDIYKMIQQAIISDNKELSKKAWELLNDNNAHKNFIWMRAQLVVDVWQQCDGKGKEEFLCLAMGQHIDNGVAYKMDDFTDEEGQIFHQYMFTDFDGRSLNYIRRIPYGEKKQDKYAYENILTKYETPNGAQIMLEAGEMRKQKEEYIKTEVEKVVTVLTKWKEDPKLSKKELHVIPWNNEDSEDDPLAERELNSIKNYLKRLDNGAYQGLFSENT